MQKRAHSYPVVKLCSVIFQKLFISGLCVSLCVCASGLLKGSVSWFVDGGDDLQPGRLASLLQ